LLGVEVGIRDTFPSNILRRNRNNGEFKLGKEQKMKKWLKIIGGAIATVVGIWLIVIFAPRVLLFLEGIVGIAVAVVGVIILAIGISELKE